MGVRRSEGDLAGMKGWHGEWQGVRERERQGGVGRSKWEEKELRSI